MKNEEQEAAKVEARTHELKTWPEYFAAVHRGEKNFEVRKNDREFKVGDTLQLFEYDPTTGYTINSPIEREVTYIAQGVFGLPEDVCVMSLAGIQHSRLPADGWREINGVEDLPKDEGYYLVWDRGSVEKSYRVIDHDLNTQQWLTYSHWRPITPPLTEEQTQ